MMSSTTKQSKTRFFLPLLTPMLLVSLLLLLIGWTSTTAFSQSETNLDRTPWQIHQGIPPNGKANDIKAVTLTGTQDIRAFAVVDIPPITDTGSITYAGWLLPTVDDNKDISIDISSKLGDCNQSVDFTYFQTEVMVPIGTSLTEFQVTFRHVDDNARIYVFNSEHMGGNFIAGGEIFGNNTKSVDLSSLVKIGEKNRVVIAQVDTCKVRNTIKNIQIVVKGSNAAGKPLPEYVPVEHNAFYVDQDATGMATGLSWTDAYTNVQDALNVAKSGTEIWVAEGVYYPDVGKGQEDNNQKISFIIPSGVEIYGGFSGTETLLDERDWRRHVTVLSGDIDQNDLADANGVIATSTHINGNNSYHVVYLDGTTNAITNTTIIDGFMVTAGNANGEEFFTMTGGGLFCDGQGVECSPSVENVIFSGNSAADSGGAVRNDGSNGISNPLFVNVIFSGNSAADSGGAVKNDGSSGISNPLFVNVIFRGNSAKFGGALHNDGRETGLSSPSLVNVVFSGNSATEQGGAIVNEAATGTSSPSLVNVTLSGNSAKFGGAIANRSGITATNNPTLRNVILWANHADEGPSIYNQDGATVTIEYSIVENGLNSIADTLSTTTNTYTNTYTNNSEADPLFVQPIDPASAPTSTGNLWLQVGSFAINHGLDSALPSNVNTDLEGNDRISDGKVDLGAYEFLPSQVQGLVVDATTDKPLPEATVCIRNTSLCATTDSNGNYIITNVSAGEQHLDVTATGYTAVAQPLTIAPGKTITQNFALSPQLAPGALRIVMMWGEHPRDMDSHLWLPSTQPYHVYYHKKGGLDNSPFAHLDIDDRESHGPETITIAKLESGIYTYALHHFAGGASIATSGVRVRVYGSTGLIGEYTPPPQGDGIWWHVFNFDGTTGQTTEVNVLQSEPPAPYQD